MKKNRMKEFEEACEFIHKEMQFYSMKDFAKEAFAIKRMYESLSVVQKRMYMWYVYSRYLNYNYKCMIWNFLNDYLEYVDLVKVISYDINNDDEIIE